MGLFILVLSIELILAFISYFILHKFNLIRSVILLAIISSSIGLVGGWVTGYRATGAYLLSSYWDQTNKQLQETRGSKMSNEESEKLYNKVITNPEFYYLCAYSTQICHPVQRKAATQSSARFTTNRSVATRVVHC